MVRSETILHGTAPLQTLSAAAADLTAITTTHALAGVWATLQLAAGGTSTPASPIRAIHGV
jgi:hypothetical protein